MRETTTPYERLGRSFVVHLARANVCSGANNAGVQFELLEQDGMSDFARGYSALPEELRDSMFGGVANHVVNNLLVWVRAVAFRALINQTAKLRFFIDPATFSQDDFIAHGRFRAEASLRAARLCRQGMRDVITALGCGEDEAECAFLYRDPISRNQLVTLLPNLRKLQAQGGIREVICNMWISALATLLTKKERETYGISE
ncbi:hypothetical protein B0F90DRAFT_1816303 [Multifurca ochricompacta]|uniref:Uncharacterized protein n=1 Tax=Multifurca ochricompacta TaxID=376703 RepID=A0AAD4M657_9AGAM|nr:hypothetical protein B0F90DRAFT_1816303 [Multifurca ochricompacta]